MTQLGEGIAAIASGRLGSVAGPGACRGASVKMQLARWH